MPDRLICVLVRPPWGAAYTARFRTPQDRQSFIDRFPAIATPLDPPSSGLGALEHGSWGPVTAQHRQREDLADLIRLSATLWFPLRTTTDKDDTP